jgi:hypothetical protein
LAHFGGDSRQSFVVALTPIANCGVEPVPIAPKAGSIGDQTQANLAVIGGICFLFPCDPADRSGMSHGFSNFWPSFSVFFFTPPRVAFSP